MIASISFREQSPSGRVIIINGAFYSGVEAVPTSIESRHDGASMRGAYPQMLAVDVTFVVASTTAYEGMINNGFSYLIDVRNVTESNPYKLYWGENYIAIYSENGAPRIVYHDVLNEVVFYNTNWVAPVDSAVSIPAIVPQLINSANGWFTSGWYVWGWRDYNAYYNVHEWTMDSVTDEPFKSNLTDFYEAVPRQDPYMPGNISGPSGGHGTFSRHGTIVPHSDLPTISALDAGFITLFSPFDTELKALAQYMWTNPLFDLSAWKKIFADPMDAILGLSIVPVNAQSSAMAAVTVGNISTGISMHLATGQYMQVDCGSLNIPEFWGAYLDYDPYTKLEIYLPYCGTHALSADDCVNKLLHLYYNIDLLSGACCAQIEVNGTVLYQFLGQCAASVPISGRDWTNMINGVISAAASIGSLVATGGASAPTSIPSLASTAVNAIKPQIEKSGAMGGAGGMLGVQKPYLILTTPRQALPDKQNTYTGYPSFITAELGDLSGYTEMEVIHLESVPCTGDEQAELERLLKEGVIL